MVEYDSTYCTFGLNLPTPNWGQIHHDPWWANQHIILWLRDVWPQFTNPKLGANSPQPLVGKPTYYFMAVWTATSMVELVHATIKYGVAPLEIGPEFAPN